MDGYFLQLSVVFGRQDEKAGNRGNILKQYILSSW